MASETRYSDYDRFAWFYNSSFGEVAAYDAEKDLGMTGNVGRMFFLARKKRPASDSKPASRTRKRSTKERAWASDQRALHE